MSKAPIDKVSLTTLAPLIGLLLIAMAGLAPWSATNAGATLDCHTLLLAGEPDPDLNDWPDAAPAAGFEDATSLTIADTALESGPRRVSSHSGAAAHSIRAPPVHRIH